MNCNSFSSYLFFNKSTTIYNHVRRHNIFYSSSRSPLSTMMSQTVVVINNMEICRKDFGEKEENMHMI